MHTSSSGWAATGKALVDRNTELAALPPFLRVLLTTDGTVTNSLEAFFWEPIAVEPIRQLDVTLTEDAPAIARVAGETVMSRRVQLRGRESDTVYVEAESLVCTDLLPENIRRELAAQHLGIGELLRECGLETYREILDIGCDMQVEQVWRSYRIVMGNHPFIQITESFPLSVYQ